MIGWVMYGWVKAANCEYNAISSDSPTYIQGSKSEIVKTARLRYCFLYGLRLCICKVESLDYGVTFIASPRNCWAWRKSDNGILCSSHRSCYGLITYISYSSSRAWRTSPKYNGHQRACTIRNRGFLHAVGFFSPMCGFSFDLIWMTSCI